MTSRRIFAVVAAIVLALIGTAAVFGYVRSADTRALAGQDAVTVYIAQKPVPAGTTFQQAIDAKLIAEQTVAAKGVPPTPMPTISPTTADLVAVSAIAPGEMVLSGRFAQETSSTSGLTIPEGQVAVSVALRDAAHVGPYVTLGSQIAIFDTFNVQTKVPGPPTPAGDHLQDDFAKTRATRLLLPKVTVIAVGGQVATPGQTTQGGADHVDRRHADRHRAVHRRGHAGAGRGAHPRRPDRHAVLRTAHLDLRGQARPGCQRPRPVPGEVNR